MSEHDVVQALQAFFDADDPYDGIDRSDGYGTDYRFTGLAVVGAVDGFDNLEVTIEVDGTTRLARLLFDRAWREASGLDDVGACAAYVVARWRTSLVDDDSDVGDDAGDEPAGASAPVDSDLEAVLRDVFGNVNRTGPGVLEVVDDGGEVFAVHATPQEWRSFDRLARGAGIDDLEDLIGSRWDDEDHIVFFRGSFHRSIRAELPPVRSRILFDTDAPS